MRVVGSLSILLVIIFAAVFIAYGQDEPTLQTPSSATLEFQPTLPPPPGQSYETPQPTWTYSPDEIAIYNQLVAEVGFEHPKLLMAARMFAQFPNPDLINFQHIQKSEFKDVEYTFVTFPYQGGGDGYLLFSMENETIKLVSENPGLVYGIEEVADRNGNGLPDYAFTHYSGGNCCPPTYLFVIEIQDDGRENIAPNNGAGQEFIDIDEDGIFEIKGVSWISPVYAKEESYTRYVYLTRIYGWDGTAYVDISAQKTSYYDAGIMRMRLQLINSGCAVYEASTLHQLLLSYYAMGRLQEGWQELKPTLGMSRCPNNDETSMLLNTFQRMVDNNQPWNNGIQTP